jgi:hypothetical protein
MIPDINIWRVANLMLKRYGDLAEVESARRADELWEVRDAAGVAIWHQVMCSQAACEFDTVWASTLTGTMTPFGEPGARFGHDM